MLFLKKHIQDHKGTIWNTLGSTAWGANSFVTLAVVSWFTSIEEVGSFGIAFTTAQLLYLIGQFGVSHYQITDYDEKYRFSDYALARCLSCILAAVICGIVILILDFSGNKVAYTICLTFFMLLNAYGDLHQNLFFQKNRLDLSGSALFFRTLLSLVVFCVVLAVSKSITLSLVVQIIVCFSVTLYYMVIFIPRLLPENKWRFSWSSCRALLVECLPLFGSLLLMNLIISAPKYSVELLMDDKAQGFYSMIFIPAQVINLCSQFLFKPYLSQYAQLLTQKNTGKLFYMLLKQLLFVWGLTLVATLATYFLGAPILGFLYNKDLSDFTIALTLVVFGGGILAVCQLFYYILVILRKQKVIFAIYIAGLLVALSSAFLLVIKAGLLGGVISFVIAHAFILVLYFAVLFSLFRRQSKEAKL